MTSVGPMFDAMGPEARRQMQAIVQAFHRVPVREFERLEFATDADYWRVLSETYHLTDHAYGDADRWASLLSSSRPGRDEAMRPSELAALAALGDPLTVFRGYSGERGAGVGSRGLLSGRGRTCTGRRGGTTGSWQRRAAGGWPKAA